MKTRSLVLSLSTSLVVISLAACAITAQRIQPQGPPPNVDGWKAVPVVDGLDRPWGMAWLPDGRILVTEKEGQIRVVAQGVLQSAALSGVPEIYSGGQGGLMDIALHPDFSRNSLVYFTASTGTGRENRTCLFRGKLVGNGLQNVQKIYQVQQDKSGGQHFGSRILWMPDKTLLMSIGDGGNPPTRYGDGWIRNQAQNLGASLGKVLRLKDDGKPASGNPLASRSGALPEVYSYGHRNIQGLARDPQSGRVWANEHGARGGDEVNLIQGGKNYGWPLATFSREYSGPEITPNTSLPGMEDPVVVWTPCPAPSGLAFYTGNRYPAWRGDLFSGGLAGADVRRIDLDSQGRVLGQQRLNIGARVRDVRQGPDGFLYLLTDEGNGRLLRIELTR
ncbi:MAG TPA: PQQ-dependent sugar dehydrogenase [Fimbriimonadaceae bacterium]|nr:PQQ-dependent sugar dehydrogenase [Fimbriimonadaceae bacterium]HRJ33043.1 PQQ-dependent sugar dehydrogenase [Fimbriimonadaceae bacterium]